MEFVNVLGSEKVWFIVGGEGFLKHVCRIVSVSFDEFVEKQ